MIILIKVISAFFASFGFSLVFRLHKQIKFGLIGSMIGALGVLIYFLTENFGSYFFSSLFVGISSEISARIFKSPSTVFLVVGIFPQVPGGTIYQTMVHALKFENDLFITSLIEAISISITIALAILFSTTIFKLYKHLTQTSSLKN